MFIDDIKKFIANNPQIVMVTNRGLETIDRKVVFIAKDLDSRYPELKEMFESNKPIIEEPIIEERVIEEVVVETPKKKSKKK